MSNLSNVVKVIGGIVAVVALGLLIGWLGSSGHRNSLPPDPLPPTTVPDTTGESRPFASAPKPIPSVPIEPVTNTNPPTVATFPSESATNWSDALEQILISPADEADKARHLLELFPRLPEEGQVEVARHLSNLMPDQDYPALGKYLADPKMPEAVLEVLLGDALNRPNAIKLPMLLSVARQPDHPKAGEAKDILELFLEENFGDDWNLWQTKVDQWLKDNPD
jgi:hypothetical protein